MLFSQPSVRCIALLSVVGALAACGGGGGDAPTSSPPTLALTLTPQGVKNFHFTWSDMPEESRYELLEDPDGASGYTKVADMAANTTSYDHEVSLPARVNARYLLNACNASGCVPSAAVSVVGSLADAIGYVKASNTQTSDIFGRSVALSGDGNTLAVGAPFEDGGAAGIGSDQSDNTLNAAGAVYVFVRAGAMWTQQAYVKPLNPTAGARFGLPVVLSHNGDTLAVSAVYEATGAASSGGVYVFARSAGGTWSQQRLLKKQVPRGFDRFGEGLALSGDGNTLGVGIPADDTQGADAGAAIVFTRDGAGLWSEQQFLTGGPGELAADFGSSVALSADGEVLAVGAPLNDSLVTDGGRVYAFRRTNNTWALFWNGYAQGARLADRFGAAVALSGDGSVLAVAVPAQDSGSVNPNNADVEDSGAVAVFLRTVPGGSYGDGTYLKAPVIGQGDQFGSAIALSQDGSSLLVTATGEDSSALGLDGDASNDSAPDSGAAYLFKRWGAGWPLTAYIKASNAGGSDQFGSAAAMSSDGNTLAIGAHGEDSAATGLGGDQANNTGGDTGAVYLY